MFVPHLESRTPLPFVILSEAKDLCTPPGSSNCPRVPHFWPLLPEVGIFRTQLCPRPNVNHVILSEAKDRCTLPAAPSARFRPNLSSPISSDSRKSF
jgi:hypothetical protein